MRERLMAILDEYEAELAEILAGKMADIRLEDECSPDEQSAAFNLYKMATGEARLNVVFPACEEAAAEARRYIEERLCD